MAGKTHLTLRIPNDMNRELVNYADENGVSKSDATRDAIREGLKMLKGDALVIEPPEGSTIRARVPFDPVAAAISALWLMVGVGIGTLI